jgi:YggT family protein
MNIFFIQLIAIIANILTLLIIVNAIMSFILPPYHPMREALGRVLHPIYAPIRKIIPPLGMFDITPIIVIILIRIIQQFLTNIILSIS